MPDPGEHVRRAADLAWVDGDDRVVVVRLGEPAADPLVLAGSAAEVWRAIGDGAQVADVVATVAAAYAEDEATVAPGVRELLSEAARSRIVDVTSAQ